LHDDGHGEDAAQQALIKLFEQASDFDASRDAVAWAIAITSYEIRSIRRRGLRRREEALDEAVDAATAGTPEAVVVERDLARAARDVLSGMREEDMTAILVAIGGRRPFGDPTFRKRLQRALARLRQAWRARHEIG